MFFWTLLFHIHLLFFVFPLLCPFPSLCFHILPYLFFFFLVLFCTIPFHTLYLLPFFSLIFFCPLPPSFMASFCYLFSLFILYAFLSPLLTFILILFFFLVLFSLLNSLLLQQISVYCFFRCAQITAIPLGTTLTFQCFDMKGRYVNIVLPGKTTYLTFCEVQIYGTPVSECSAC